MVYIVHAHLMPIGLVQLTPITNLEMESEWGGYQEVESLT